MSKYNYIDEGQGVMYAVEKVSSKIEKLKEKRYKIEQEIIRLEEKLEKSKWQLTMKD